MEVTIRGAEPEDADRVAELFDMSAGGPNGRTIFEYLFPGSVEQRLEKLKHLYLDEDKLFLHYSNQMVVEVDGEVASVLGTSTARQNTIRLWIKACRRLGLTFFDIIKAYTRMVPYLYVVPNIHEGTVELETGATFPEYRRRGFLYLLSQEIVRSVVERDFKRIQFVTLIGNTPVEDFVAKLGPSTVKEKRSKGFERMFGSPGYLIYSFELDRETLHAFELAIEQRLQPV